MKKPTTKQVESSHSFILFYNFVLGFEREGELRKKKISSRKEML